MSPTWQDLQWSGIARAAFEIALDNGGINRCRSIEVWRADYAAWVRSRPAEVLAPIDYWLRALPEQQIALVCCGGQDEPETIEARAGAPPGTEDLLNCYFDEVC